MSVLLPKYVTNEKGELCVRGIPLKVVEGSVLCAGKYFEPPPL